MIEVESLSKFYGETRALVDVSFSIDERSIVGFLGLNGAGKSTLLEILGGLLYPSAGRVEVGGIDALDAPDELRSRIGFLPEDPPLYDDMRVENFLLWCGQIKGADRSTLARRLEEVAEVCDIAHMTDRVVGTLSHGYRKRVGIAQAIIHDPELVILDEPISGLDPVQIVEMRDVLRRLREECTVLVSSHNLNEISETCDRVLVLHQGRLVADQQLGRSVDGDVVLQMKLRSDLDLPRRVFEQHEAVLDWKVVDEEGTPKFTVGLRGGDPSEREELVAALVDEGVGIRRLTESLTDLELEETFLGATGGAEEPGDAGTAGARSADADELARTDASREDSASADDESDATTESDDSGARQNSSDESVDTDDSPPDGEVSDDEAAEDGASDADDSDQRSEVEQ